MEGAMSPLVSVIIPTHNRPDFLRDAIASVKAQTFTDYEIIVVSNGERSDKRQTSRALAVANGCLYLELSKGNVSLARNAGIERSRGEWIAFLDDDDLWLPHKLDRQIADARLTGADMIACDYVEFFPNGHEVIRRPRCVEGWPYVKAINNTYWYALAISVVSIHASAVVPKMAICGVGYPGIAPSTRWTRF
jgi:glycosyltransferase involved in cell wall biosynthesis